MKMSDEDKQKTIIHSMENVMKSFETLEKSSSDDEKAKMNDLHLFSFQTPIFI